MPMRQLLEAARAAFQAQIRAYATHPVAMRGIFNVRQLHLGHLAKSFALRETPTAVTTAQGKTVKAATERKRQQRERALFTEGRRRGRQGAPSGKARLTKAAGRSARALGGPTSE